MTQPTPGLEQGLTTLLERVKAATGPDRELDFRIHIAAVDDAIWPVRDRLGRVTNPNYRMSDYLNDFAGVINSDDQDFDFARYTASIDAAIALVERVAPGGLLDLTLGYEPGSADRAWPAVTLRFYPDGVTVDGKQWHCAIEGAATPPLAILAALLSALSRANGEQP